MIGSEFDYKYKNNNTKKCLNFLLGTKITIFVKPNHSEDSIEIKFSEIHVSTRAPPDKGKANKAIVKLLSNSLGISTSSIGIISGHTSRTKTISIEGLTEIEVLDILENK